MHILVKSDKNIGHFTWSVFHIVVSAMCNTTIQITQCCASMTRHSVFITLLTVTFVRHHYKGKALLLFNAKWLLQPTTIFTYCLLFLFFLFLIIKPSLQLTCLFLKESSKLWKALNCIQRGIERGYVGSWLGVDTQQSPDVSVLLYRRILAVRKNTQKIWNEEKWLNVTILWELRFSKRRVNISFLWNMALWPSNSLLFWRSLESLDSKVKTPLNVSIYLLNNATSCPRRLVTFFTISFLNSAYLLSGT